jgi:hypothetical protein
MSPFSGIRDESILRHVDFLDIRHIGDGIFRLKTSWVSDTAANAANHPRTRARGISKTG